MFWEFPESELILHEQPQHHHQQPRHKVCTIIISTVQMWKLRHREVKEHSQGHTARKWRTGIQVFALKGLHSSVVRPASLPSIFSRLGRGGASRSVPRSTQPFSSWDIPEFSQRTGKTWERGESHLVVREGERKPGPILHVYIPLGQPHILVFQVLKVLTHQSLIVFDLKF